VRRPREVTQPPILLPFDGVAPLLASPPAHCGWGAAVLGRARVGADAWLGHHATLRADGQAVRVGERFHLGAHGTVHIAHETLPAIVGDGVTAGRHAVIHACEIGDECVLEDGTTVLDGAVVGRGSIVERDAVVFPRARLAPGRRYAGNPARPVGDVDAAALAERHAALRALGARTDLCAPPEAPAREAAPGAFVAPSARCTGSVRLDAEASIWFGCVLHGGGRGLHIGRGTNVQDNSFLYALSGELVLEENVTVGHNVFMQDCRVMAGSLVGISSALAPGTIVERDVLVAAGTVTTPGQVLEAGFLWGGRPARPIRPLDATLRELLEMVPPIYRIYAAEFAARCAAAASGR